LSDTVSLTREICKDVSDCIITRYEHTWAYSFNGTESAELSFQVGFFDFITKARNKESLEWVTSGLRIFLRVDCKAKATMLAYFEIDQKKKKMKRTIFETVCDLLLLLFFFFCLLAVFALDPAFSSIVRHFFGK